MNWNLTDRILPRNGEVVEVITPSGTEQRMKLRGGLWFFEDDSMYVYYAPILWREIEEPERDGA